MITNQALYQLSYQGVWGSVKLLPDDFDNPINDLIKGLLYELLVARAAATNRHVFREGPLNGLRLGWAGDCDNLQDRNPALLFVGEALGFLGGDWEFVVEDSGRTLAFDVDHVAGLDAVVWCFVCHTRALLPCPP